MTNEKAISTIENAKNFAYDDVYEEAFDMAINALKEQKKGHWILGGYDDNYYICDKCNYKASEYYFKPRYNFCPNCGARMVESEVKK